MPLTLPPSPRRVDIASGKAEGEGERERERGHRSRSRRWHRDIYNASDLTAPCTPAALPLTSRFVHSPAGAGRETRGPGGGGVRREETRSQWEGTPARPGDSALRRPTLEPRTPALRAAGVTAPRPQRAYRLRGALCSTRFGSAPGTPTEMGWKHGNGFVTSRSFPRTSILA